MKIVIAIKNQYAEEWWLTRYKCRWRFRKSCL